MCNPQYLVTISMQLNNNPFIKNSKNLILWFNIREYLINK
jgi:hypothetical protein